MCMLCGALEDTSTKMRTFETGATRDITSNKPDFEGYLSPLVLEEFGNYMRRKQIQPDGNLRNSDNWQKGIPKAEYLKSAWRHLMHWWLLHREFEALDEKGNEVTMEDTLCAIMFNVMGYLHETRITRE